MNAELEKLVEPITNNHDDDALSESSNDECDDNCHDHDHQETSASGKPISRNEKKARKTMAKLGLKPVEGINRVSIKTSRKMVFAIQEPEVFKSPTSDTYIIFGEAKTEDMGGFSSQVANQFKAAEANKKPVIEEEETGDENIDESGLDQGDIATVMDQGNCSRARAVKALRASGNDIVNAIMELSM